MKRPQLLRRNSFRSSLVHERAKFSESRKKTSVARPKIKKGGLVECGLGPSGKLALGFYAGNNEILITHIIEGDARFGEVHYRKLKKARKYKINAKTIHNLRPAGINKSSIRTQDRKRYGAWNPS